MSLNPHDELRLSRNDMLVEAFVWKVQHVPGGTSPTVHRFIVQLKVTEERYVFECTDESPSGVTAEKLEQFPLEHTYWKPYRPEFDERF